VLPEIPPRWVEIHRRCLAGAVEKCDEDPFPRADGRTDWIRWEVRPWRRADGSIGGIIIFSEDVSERKHGEAALRASEDRYRTLFDCAPDGIVIANRESYYLDANASMCTMLGYTRDELIGMHASDIVAPTEAGHIGLALKTIDATSEYHREWQLRRKDGTIFPADVQASVTPDGNVMAIVRDVSERNRAIEAVSVLEQQYQQAQKMEAVGQLAGGVAHDFNNLLTAILGFGRLVLDTFPPDDQRRGDVEQIIQAGDRASALTRQLLAFSRKEMVQPVAMNLNELIVDTHKMVRRLIGEDIEVQLRLADDLGAVQADPGQVDQILVNLAVNARDAMPDGGRLTIETANVELDASFGSTHGPVEPGPYVMLAVADTGTGMTEDTRRRLFEPFFTTKARGKGTGLGLSTVFGIVKQNGGFLYVYSEPGQGAIFKIYFPRLAAGTSTVLPIPSAAPRSGSETVLLVEDEHAVRLLVRAILESAGYRVLEAANPPDAAASFGDRIGEVDLLVTDVIMPGGTGPALFAQLRSTSPRLRVLYISGYTDDATFRTGRLEPGVAFLQKPFAADVLLRKLREVLDSRHPQHDDEKAS
jgi:two-component system cell cycle sensor histidine kinase/response regulator CckA